MQGLSLYCTTHTCDDACDSPLKIADFGMSRDLADEDIYVSHGGVIPVRWTAPEAISQKKYSTASDVWSFGCVLYEIWSLGHKPFEDTQLKEVSESAIGVSSSCKHSMLLSVSL